MSALLPSDNLKRVLGMLDRKVPRSNSEQIKSIIENEVLPEVLKMEAKQLVRMQDARISGSGVSHDVYEPLVRSNVQSR